MSGNDEEVASASEDQAATSRDLEFPELPDHQATTSDGEQSPSSSGDQYNTSSDEEVTKSDANHATSVKTSATHQNNQNATHEQVHANFSTSGDTSKDIDGRELEDASDGREEEDVSDGRELEDASDGGEEVEGSDADPDASGSAAGRSSSKKWPLKLLTFPWNVIAAVCVVFVVGLSLVVYCEVCRKKSRKKTKPTPKVTSREQVPVIYL